MSERKATHSCKDAQGNITGLSYPGIWKETKSQIIADIENGRHQYYTHKESPKSYVEIYTRNGIKHIRTDADSSSKNNLDNLPDC